MQKSGILSQFCSCFKCATTHIIVSETGITNSNIEIRRVSDVVENSGEETLFQIDEKKREIIFVSDDKRFINLCKKEGKVVINSLLIPILIYEVCENFSFEDTIKKIEEIYSLGYYSFKVYLFALQIFFERKYWLNCLFPHLRL